MDYKITHFPDLEHIVDKNILSVRDKILSLATIEFENGDKFHFILPSSKLNTLFWNQEHYGINFFVDENFNYFLPKEKIEILNNTKFEEERFWNENVEQYEEQKENFFAGNNATIKLLKNTIRNIKEEPEWVQNDETPVDSIGKTMEFIGQLYIGDYVDDVDTDIFMFYSKIDKTVVQIYQFG